MPCRRRRCAAASPAPIPRRTRAASIAAGPSSYRRPTGPRSSPTQTPRKSTMNDATRATPDGPACRPASMELWWEIQDLLYAEADLLDQRRDDDWLALLHPDIKDRMPQDRNMRR